jgi:GH24 family phage-related lysozyme (muramidase)
VRPAARDAFWAFSVKHEGLVLTPYLDILGLVTVGVGNLIDPLSQALHLPFLHRGNGMPATKADITADWLKLKGQACGRYQADTRCGWTPDKVCLAHKGWVAAAQVTGLYLPEDSVRWLVDKKLAENVERLRDRYPAWDTFPADAQLAIAGMAWAMGPGYRFPMFDTAVNHGEWAIAAIESKMTERGNPGIIRRNVDHRHMLLNAHRVDKDGLDRDTVFWPALVEAPVTLREMPAAEDVGDFREQATVAAESFGARRAMLSDAMVRRSSEELALDLEKLGEGD